MIPAGDGQKGRREDGDPRPQRLANQLVGWIHPERTVRAILIDGAAVGIYYCERDIQPEAFESIPPPLWWAVITGTWAFGNRRGCGKRQEQRQKAGVVFCRNGLTPKAAQRANKGGALGSLTARARHLSSAPSGPPRADTHGRPA